MSARASTVSRRVVNTVQNAVGRITGYLDVQQRAAAMMNTAGPDTAFNDQAHQSARRWHDWQWVDKRRRCRSGWRRERPAAEKDSAAGSNQAAHAAGSWIYSARSRTRGAYAAASNVGTEEAARQLKRVEADSGLARRRSTTLNRSGHRVHRLRKLKRPRSWSAKSWTSSSTRSPP